MNEVMTAADASSSLRNYSSQPSLAPSNFPLVSAFLACAVAQFLKIFTYWFKERKWDSRRMLSSGGMPSSHSATVTALAVAIGFQEGPGGSAFAIAVVLACVVMYDATGVRLHAGRQAELLNQIVCELPPEHPVANVRPLRDSLGHTPLQVVAGALLGAVVAYIIMVTPGYAKNYTRKARERALKARSTEGMVVFFRRSGIIVVVGAGEGSLAVSATVYQ